MSAARLDRRKLVFRVSRRLVRGVMTAVIFGLLVLFALAVSGCAPNATEREIAIELAGDANRLCWEAGGLPQSRWHDGDRMTVLLVDCNEVDPAKVAERRGDTGERPLEAPP